MKLFKAMLFCIFVVSSVISNDGLAAIYKYRDDSGFWQFSDRPPADDRAVVTIKYVAKDVSKKEDTTENIGAALREQFHPTSPLEEATLAVVTIKTSITEGSGFFVSNDGLLITNKHVIDFTGSPQWKEAKDKLADSKERFREAERALRHERKQLKKYETKLRDYESRVVDGNLRWYEEQDYHRQKGLYDNRKAEYDRAYRNYAELKREFDKAKREFSIADSTAKVQRRYKVILKDGRELRAERLAYSREFDLALLEVSGHATPSLTVAGADTVSQGAPVYAIGSPLGLQDSVTSGIVTHLGEDSIVTDAQILPGNSGGPLINAKGEVLGVNTLKVAESVSAQGFGVAIPINVVVTEFEEFLGRRKLLAVSE